MRKVTLVILIVGFAIVPLAAQQPVDICDEQYTWCREGCITYQCVQECREYRMECVTGKECNTTSEGVIICLDNQS